MSGEGSDDWSLLGSLVRRGWDNFQSRLHAGDRDDFLPRRSKLLLLQPAHYPNNRDPGLVRSRAAHRNEVFLQKTPRGTWTGGSVWENGRRRRRPLGSERWS